MGINNDRMRGVQEIDAPKIIKIEISDVEAEVSIEAHVSGIAPLDKVLKQVYKLFLVSQGK